MIQNHAYLIRRNGIFYFSRRVPADVRSRFNKDRVIVSLHTRSLPKAQRCGAKTRRGTACQRPANKKNGRCRLHGGASTGARSEAGLARISAANLRHGKFTKDKLEKRRENAAKGREIRNELRQMERDLIAGGLLDKHWRDSFPS